MDPLTNGMTSPAEYPCTFRIRRGKLLALGAICVVLSASLVKHAPTASGWGWFDVGMLALTALAGVLTVLAAVRREPRLTLTADGFVFGTWIGSRTFRWSECRDFHIRNFMGFDLIYFRRDGHRGYCAFASVYDSPAEDILRVMDARSRRARDGAYPAAGDRA